MPPLRFRKLFASLFVFASLCVGAQAETYYWIGNDLGRWNVATNWNTQLDGSGSSPTGSLLATDEVIISTTNAPLISDTDFTTNPVSSITIKNGASLYINSSVDLTSTTLINNGTLYFCHNTNTSTFTLTVGNHNLGNLVLWGQTEIVINGNASAASISMTPNSNTNITENFTAKLSGSGSLSIGNGSPAVNLTRCADNEHPNVTGTFEIDVNVNCTGTIDTHSGVTLKIDSEKTLTAGGITHSALSGSPASKIENLGTIDVGTTGTIDLSGNNNAGCTQLVNSGTIKASAIQIGTADTKDYNNTGITNPIINNGTIEVSSSFTLPNFSNTGTFTPYSGSGTIKLNGNGAKFDNKNTSHSVTVNELQCLDTSEISGNTTFNTVTAENLSDKSLTVNGEQTIQSSISVSGTVSHLLTLTGNGTISTTTLSADYLAIDENINLENYTVSIDHCEPAAGSSDASWLKVIQNGWAIKAVKNFDFTWTGNTDSDWNEKTNWDTLLVPETDCKITIPAGCTNYPELGSGTYNGGTLTLSASDSKITLGAANLSLSGKENDTTATTTLSNAGTIVYTNTGRITNGTDPINDTTQGTVEYSNTGSGSITDFDTGSGDDYYKLSINGTGWQLGSSLKLNTITLETGANCTLSAASKIQAVNFNFNGKFTSSYTLTLTPYSNTSDFTIPSTIDTFTFSGSNGWLYLGDETDFSGNLIFDDSLDLTYKIQLNSSATLNSDINVRNSVTAKDSISGTGTLIFTGTGTQQFNPTTSKTYLNIKVDKTNGSVTIHNDNYTITNFSVTNGTTTFSGKPIITNCTITNATSTTFSGTPTITNYSDTENAGIIIFDAGGTINTSGGQTFNTEGKVTLKGPINIGSTSPYLNLTHTAGETEINGTLNAAEIILGTTRLATANINGTSLTIGNITASGSSTVTTSGAQNYDGTVSSNTASLSIAQATTVNFAKPVTLNTLSITQASSTTFDDIVTLSTFTDAAAHTGSITFKKDGSITAITDDTIHTSGIVTIGDGSVTPYPTLTIDGNITHTTGDTVINGTLSAADITLAKLTGSSITITNSGTLTLGTADQVSCTSFTQNGSGSISLGRDITTTAGTISFNKNITLTADSTLTANGSNGGITLNTNSSVDGAHKLTLISDTNNITINSAIGSTSPISEIEVQGNGIINNSITTSGNQTYQGEVSGAQMIYTGADITFASKLTSTGKITLENSGVLSLATATPVSCTEFEQKGTGTVSLGRDITASTGDITLTGVTTLSSSVELKASTAEKNVTIKSTVSGTGKTLKTTATNTNISSAGNNTITADSFTVSNNLVINNTGTSPADTTTIEAATSVDGTLTLTAGNLSISTGKNISVKGNVTNSSTGTINGDGTLKFTGEAVQTFTTNGTSYTNVIEDKSTSTGKLSISGDCSISSFTIQNGKDTAFNGTPTISTFTDAETSGLINFTNGGTISNSLGTTFLTTSKVTFAGTMTFGTSTPTPAYAAVQHTTTGPTEISGTLNAAAITLGVTKFTTANINGTSLTVGNLTVSGNSTITTSGAQNYNGTVSPNTGSLSIAQATTVNFAKTVTLNTLTITQATSTTFYDTVRLSTFADDTAHTGSITFKKDTEITTITGGTINTTGVFTVGNNSTTPASTATLTVGSNFTHNAQTIIYGTLNASGKDISLGLTTGGPVTLVGNNITLNDNLTSSSTITITNSGLFKTADGKAISYTGPSAAAAGFTQTNTSAGSSMLGGSFSGTGTASFTKHVYLYGNGAADFGSNGSEISIAENSNLIIARDSGTLSINADKITANNIVLYKGSVNLSGILFSYKDIIILGGSSYSTEDSATGYTNEYAYNTPRPAGWSTVQYTFESQFPDSATAISMGTTNLTVDAGKILHAGKNFYVNGSTLSGSSTWYIDILSNLNPANCFAEAYNCSINNCTVRRYESDNTTDDSGDYAQIPTENCSLTNCNNFDDTLFEITDAHTVRDNSIYVEFNRAVRYHSTSLSYLKFLNASSSPVCSFENLYSQADCQNILNYDTQSSHFYIKAAAQNGAAVGGGAWNTDATGTSSGTGNQSCDRNGIHHDTIPSLDFPRAFGNTTTATISFIITDRWGKRLNNYSSRSNGTTYTSVADKTGPVLWTVRTGQELHDAYDTATGEASQHSYDSHNFLEFRYSEPVTFNSDSIPNNAENIQVTDSFGAIQENIATSSPQTLSFAGLAKITDSILYTGSQGSANKYMNALYRTDDYSIRLSIAGWTDGTVTDYAGNEYKKWPGYIEAATQFKDKLVTSIADPITHENTFVKDMATTPNSQIEYPINPTEPVVNDDSTGLLETPSPDTYSPWDLSSPVFTPLRFSRETDWGDQAMSEAIGNTNGSGSTLDRIDFHFFDNTPAYDDTDTAEWFTEIGWCTPGSEASKSNLKASYSYAADIIGGARPFGSDANRTSGGIRFSTKADISPAFKYSTSANNPSPSTNFQTGIANLHTTVVSQLFTGSSAPMRPANDPDGLYLGLGLTDSSLSVETTFAFSYNDSLGYLTDLAGNRLRSKVSKTIDRTPPSFDAIISPVDTKSVYLLFVKQLVTDSSRIKFRDNSGTNVNIIDSFATLMPKCFRIISIDASGTAVVSTENQIDTSVPAEVVESFSNDSFTCIKLTTTKEINIENLKNLYIQLITPAEYPQTASDPLTNNTGSRVTLIQDHLGNYMSMYSAHALSDFAVNYVNPLYAYSTDMLYEDQSIMNGLYEAGSWAVHDWNADQQNYGTLPAGYPISIVADTKGDEKIRVYLSPSPDADSVSKQFNSDFDAKFRIWLPALQDSLFRALSAANNTNFVYSDGQLLDASSANSLFNITKETVSSWQSGSQISFMFGLMQNSNSPVRIYNTPYYDVSTDKFNLSLSIPVPLYCLRMTDTADLNTLDLWSFKIKGITAQRGGVTILNNVINASNDEKAVVIVDMPEDGNLTVCVMTLDGNIITYLNRGNTKAGEYYYTWNGKNRNGKAVARGMYFVRVLGGGIDETRKVMVVKED